MIQEAPEPLAEQGAAAEEAGDLLGGRPALGTAVSVQVVDLGDHPITERLDENLAAGEVPVERRSVDDGRCPQEAAWR